MTNLVEKDRTCVDLSTSGVAAKVTPSLNELLQIFAGAWRAGDCEAIIQLMAPDVIWVNSYGEFLHGSEQAAEHLRSTLCLPFDPDITPSEAEHLHAVANTHMGDNVVSVQLFAVGPVRQRTVSMVCEKASDRWLIRHCMIGSCL